MKRVSGKQPMPDLLQDLVLGFGVGFDPDFDLGHVVIQTAAENGAIVFRLAPQPDTIQTEILRRLEHYAEAQAALRRKESESDMADWFEAYATLAGEDSRTPMRR